MPVFSPQFITACSANILRCCPSVGAKDSPPDNADQNINVWRCESTHNLSTKRRKFFSLKKMYYFDTFVLDHTLRPLLQIILNSSGTHQGGRQGLWIKLNKD